MTWRDWFPWPIGTHWCWFETTLAWIAGPVVAMNIVVIALALLGLL